MALRTNPEVTQFIHRDVNQSISDIEEFIERITSDPEKLFYKIELVETGELVGAIALKNINKKKQYAEIGYELFPHFQRKGIMSTAMTKMITMAFHDLGITELEAYTHRENTNSRKLLEKFKFELVEGKVDAGNLNNVVYRLMKQYVY